MPVQGRPEADLAVPSESELARVQAESARQIQRSERTFRLAYGLGVFAVLVFLASLPLIPLLDDQLQLTIGLLLALMGVVALAVAVRRRRSHVRVATQFWEHLQHLLERLQESSARDSLTGLYNHGYLLRRIQEEISRAERYRRPLSIVILDLNDFKEVNDRHGHLEGDTVLQIVAATIRQQMRDHDIVGRYGGDEFCIVLPETTRDEAEDVLPRLRAAIDALPDTVEGWNGGRLGFSCGVTTYPEDGATTHALIAAADSGLYQEKQTQRLERAHEQGAQAQNLFYQFGETVASTLDPEQRLASIAKTICSSLNLRSASIFWHEQHGPQIETQYFTEPELEAAVREALRREPLVLDRTVAYKAVQRNEIVTLERLSEDRGVPRQLAAALPRDFWGQWIPITIQGRRSGALRLFGRAEEASPLDLNMARALARLIGGSIQNSLDYEEARRQRDRLTALADVGALLVKTDPLEDRLRNVAQRIVEAVGSDTVTLLTRDPGTDESIVTSTFTKRARYLAEAWEHYLQQQPREFMQQLRRAGDTLRKPFVVDEPAEHPVITPFLQDIYRRGRIRALLIMPLRFQDESLGVMAVMSAQSKAFNDETISLFHTIASQIAPSLKSALLHYELEQSYEALRQAHVDAMLRLAAVAEARDPFTGNHLHRLREYTEAIARKLGLSKEEATALGHAAVVHDIGKLRVPDALLAKAAKLTEEEWAIIRKHPVYGEELLGENSFYSLARQVARWHHERWDGSGYPDGLRGETIPLGPRIVAVADVFDALTSRRLYKEAWTIADAVDYIREQRGKQFAPDVVDAFLSLANDGALDALAGPVLESAPGVFGPDDRLVA